MKKIFTILAATLFVSTSYACFDTYLFLNKKSMVYPTGMFAFDTLIEYSGNKIVSPEEDTLFMNVNLFYGVSKEFSVQIGISTSEATRYDVLNIESFGIRAVYNVISHENKNLLPNTFTFDIILEHHQGIFGKNISFDFSFPGIAYIDRFAIVVHPVFSLADIEKTVVEYSLGGHLGIFYLLDNTLLGIGAEYNSAQNGSTFGSRIIEGESGISLFFGAKLGNNIYIQNEFAKGIANSRDFGFAFTMKIIP
ncbi:MAG: hypothetical protein ACK4F9_03475 [Brevinematia bacterium]